MAANVSADNSVLFVFIYLASNKHTKYIKPMNIQYRRHNVVTRNKKLNLITVARRRVALK